MQNAVKRHCCHCDPISLILHHTLCCRDVIVIWFSLGDPLACLLVQFSEKLAMAFMARDTNTQYPKLSSPLGSPWCLWGRWGPGHWQSLSLCCHSKCPAPDAWLRTHTQKKENIYFTHPMGDSLKQRERESIFTIVQTTWLSEKKLGEEGAGGGSAKGAASHSFPSNFSSDSHPPLQSVTSSTI